MIYKQMRSLKAYVKPWMAAPAVASAMLAGSYAVSYADTTLTSFSARAVGIAVISGVEPSKRNVVFLLALAACAFAAAAVVLLLALFRRAVESKGVCETFEPERSLAFALSLAASLLLALDYYKALLHAQYGLSDVSELCWALMSALAAHSAFKLLAHKSSIQSGERELYLVLLLPAALCFSILYFISDGVVSCTRVTAYALYLALTAALELTMRYAKVDKGALARASVALFALPAAAVFANELQYTLRRSLLLDVKVIAGFFALIAAAVFVLVYFKSKGKALKTDASLFENVVFPLALASLALIAASRISVNWPYLDLLHGGNKVVSAQQVSQFGRIPYVDFLQGQDVRLGSILYALINRASAFEAVIWDDMLASVMSALVGYFALKKIMPARWVFVIFLFTPALGLCSEYYIGALLPLLYLGELIKKRRVRDYAVFALLSLVCFAWMPSMGKPAVVAALVTAALLSLFRKNILKCAGGFALAFGSAFAVYCALTLARGASIKDNVTLILALSEVEFSVGGYVSLLAHNTPQLLALLVYGLMPLLCVFMLVAALFKKGLREDKYAFVFIAVAALVCATRTLARHALLESNEHYCLYALAVLCVPFVFEGVDIKLKQALNTVFMVVFTLTIGVSYPPLAAALESYEYKTFAPNETRYSIDEQALPQNFINVINEYLDENQTFFEFANAHMLYTLTDREDPVFHHSIHAAYPEQTQELFVKRLAELYDAGRLPAIVFEGDDWELSRMDGIPSYVGAFKVAEFIYEHYEPCCKADGFWIWTADNSDLRQRIEAGKPAGAVMATDCSQRTDILRLAYVWGNSDVNCERIKASEPMCVMSPLSLAGGAPQTVTLKPDIDKTDGNYLLLRIGSETETTVTVKYGERASEMMFTALTGERDYLVRISMQYEWMSERISALELSSPSPIEITRFEVLAGD